MATEKTTPRSEPQELVPRIEAVDPTMAEVYARMSGAERLALANRMFVDAREMLLAHLADEHADWSAEEVRREAARRLSRGAV